MKENLDKCHLICSTNDQIILSIKSEVIKNSNNNNDNRLTFKNHIDDICKKAGQKLNALSRMTPHVGFTKKRTYKLMLFSYPSVISVT